MNNQEIQDREENIEKRNAIIAKKKELANVKFNFKNYIDDFYYGYCPYQYKIIENYNNKILVLRDDIKRLESSLSDEEVNVK